MKIQNENVTFTVERFLRAYTNLQKENWKHSKKIEIYQDQKQLKEFVKKAKTRENAGKKLYFGMVPEKTASMVKQRLALDIKNFNCALYSDNVKKIFKDHGNESKESLRGQRAVTVEDFYKIPEIVSEPDRIESGGQYKGHPVIHFAKDGVTVVGVIAEGALDLYPQTMYISKKNRSLATVIDEQAPIYTPETTRSTASNNSIYQNIKNTIDFFKILNLYKTTCVCYDI